MKWSEAKCSIEGCTEPVIAVMTDPYYSCLKHHSEILDKAYDEHYDKLAF